MFNVSTVNLTADLAAARPDLGIRSLGKIEPASLAEILEMFRLIDPVQNHDAAPEIIIEGFRGTFLVRTDHGKLFVHDPREPQAAGVELAAPAIVRELARTPAPLTRHSPSGENARRWARPAVAITILAASVILNLHTVRAMRRIDRVETPPPVQLVTDPRELSALQASAKGRYTTGTEPGERVIEVRGDGHIQFRRLTASGDRLDSEDTYQIGRVDGKRCLATPDSGVIEVSNIETLVYYRDVYRRVR